MKKVCFLAVCFLISGCAPLLQGNEYGGRMTTNLYTEPFAMETAEKHCKKYNKKAKITGGSGSSVTFECL